MKRFLGDDRGLRAHGAKFCERCWYGSGTASHYVIATVARC